jgi:hypothetical protein
MSRSSGPGPWLVGERMVVRAWLWRRRHRVPPSGRDRTRTRLRRVRVDVTVAFALAGALCGVFRADPGADGPVGNHPGPVGRRAVRVGPRSGCRHAGAALDHGPRWQRSGAAGGSTGIHAGARFPDGQIYVNLHGYGPGEPAGPIDALARILATLGTPAGAVPDEPEQAAALYRSMMAGKRMLVLLDNARCAEQVRPLLPGSAACLVLVTSRHRLVGLIARDGAVGIDLDVLVPDEAQALLVRLLGLERVYAEPEAAADVARVCGYLPLVLRVAATNLTACAARTIAAYTSDLGGGDGLGPPWRWTGIYPSRPDPSGRAPRLVGSLRCRYATCDALVLLPGGDNNTKASRVHAAGIWSLALVVVEATPARTREVVHGHQRKPDEDRTGRPAPG